MTVRLLLALLLGLACALLVACSDRSSLIPANDAAALKDDIAEVQQAIDDGDCTAAIDATKQLDLDARNLPSEVDRKLSRDVRDAADRAERLVPGDCQPRTATIRTTTTATNTTPTTTTTTTTTPTTTTTTTTPTTGTSTTTTPTTTTPIGTGGIPPTGTDGGGEGGEG